MPLNEVTDAIQAYLDPSAAAIPNYGALYRSLPKVSNEADLFTNTYPGLGIGATIYFFCVDQKESRIALGGPPPPYGGGGRKFVEYSFSFLIVFKSDLSQTIDGQLMYDNFKDAFTARIRANRTAGTDNTAAYGGDGTGVIFQWGEGGINGGDDIIAQHFIPRTVDGGVTLFQSLYRLNVCEVLNT